MNVPWKKPSTVGRELDHRFALLTGEGAGQKVKHPAPGPESSVAVPLWREVPSGPGKVHPDYYRLPLVKQPVWIWSVPAYFYVGGVAGGTAVLSAFLRGKRPVSGLASACRWLSFLGTAVGPALLTWDLGKMQRFTNMLRVFRPSSPMSVGSWTLAGSGALATLALLKGDRDSSRAPSLALAAGGLVLAGYTGVLLGNTANPLWNRTRRSLPVLFTAASMASTAGVLEFFSLNEEEEGVVRRFGILGKLAESASIAVMEQEASGNPEAAQSLKEGKAGLLWETAKSLVTVGTLLSLVPVKSRWKRRLGGAITTAGAIALRYALLESGKQASLEPKAVVAGQRRSSPSSPSPSP